MKYAVRWKSSTAKDFKGLRRETARKIRMFVETDLSLNPRLGEPLQGRWRPLWRVRFGDYRIIYAFSDQEIWILVVRVAHRKEAYRR